MAEPLSPQHRSEPPSAVPANTQLGAKLGWADAMMLFTAIVFGSSFPVAKPILPAMDPFFYAAARYLLAAVAVFLYLRLRGARLGLDNVDRKLLAVCCISFAIFQGNWAFDLTHTDASVGPIFMATSPIFGALLARLSGHRLRPLGWIGIALAFCGVLLVINNSLSAITVTFDSVLYDGLWLCNAILWALFAARSPRLIATLGAVRMSAWLMLFTALLLAPLAIWGGLRMDWPAFPPLLWLNFLYTSLITAGLASIFWNIGIGRLGITRTMIYLYLVPIFAVTIAVIFLGEVLTLARALGGVAVLIGIYITRRAAT
ncbi:MAG: DMT family transporter [Rhodospirillales bacterium]